VFVRLPRRVAPRNDNTQGIQHPVKNIARQSEGNVP
jgi:hypothetical protein